MTNEEKYRKLLKIVEQVQEIYPDLDRLVVNDLEDPNSVIITSEANLQMVAKETGMDYAEEFDQITSDNLLGYDGDDDDDNDGGTFH